jgi:hypothetical protein
MIVLNIQLCIMVYLKLIFLLKLIVYFFEATFYKNTKLMTFLLENNADPCLKNSDGVTPYKYGISLIKLISII